MTKYKIRYTPEAMRDMDAVWDGVYDSYIEVIRIIMEKRDYMKILFVESE